MVMLECVPAHLWMMAARRWLNKMPMKMTTSKARVLLTSCRKVECIFYVFMGNLALNVSLLQVDGSLCMSVRQCRGGAA